MKIRKGFVSNSSSASFVVKVDKSIDEFLDELYNEFEWTNFRVDRFKIVVEADIKRNEGYIEDFKKDMKNDKWQHLTKSSIEQCELQNKGLRLLLEGLPKLSKRNLVTTILNHNHVSIGASRNGKCELSGWTVMYNSASDAPEFLHMIVFYLALTYPCKNYEVTVERDD